MRESNKFEKTFNPDLRNFRIEEIEVLTYCVKHHWKQYLLSHLVE